MASNNTMYKHLLIPVKKSKGVKLPINTSPLLRNFEKWSGIKKKKLYFPDVASLRNSGIKDFKLDQNMFAKILSSPIRHDRLSRLRSPKELLLQVKSGQDYQIKLAVKQDKTGKNSYVTNSVPLIKSMVKHLNAVLPLHFKSSTLLSELIPKLKLDSTTFLSEYQDNLATYISDQIKQHKDSNKLNSDIHGMKVILHFDESLIDNNCLNISRDGMNGNSPEIRINMAVVNSEQWKKLFSDCNEIIITDKSLYALIYRYINMYKIN